MIALRFAPCVSFGLLMLVACDRPAKVPRERPPPPTARIERSIELPGGQGTAHILFVPTGILESSRCVVVIGATGAPAVSCTPKDIDLSLDKD